MVTAKICREIAAERLAQAAQDPGRHKALTEAAQAWLLLADRMDARKLEACTAPDDDQIPQRSFLGCLLDWFARRRSAHAAHPYPGS